MKNGLVMFNDDGTSAEPQSPEERAKEKLLFLLRTPKGSIANDLSYGTELHTLAHRPINTDRKSVV